MVTAISALIYSNLQGTPTKQKEQEKLPLFLLPLIFYVPLLAIGYEFLVLLLFLS